MSAAPSRQKDAKSSDSSSSSKPRKRPVRTVSTPSNVSPAKKPRPSVSTHPGRDYDLNEIRSELKGLHTVKPEPEETIVKQEIIENEPAAPSQPTTPPTEPPKQEKQPEDVYEFKEPEPFELELHDEKKKRTHRIFDDISPSKYTSTLSKSLSEEISEDPLRPRPSLRSPSLSPFRDFGASRDTPGRQSTEDDTKDDVFSLDDDSFQDGVGPIFEGFTPAKNQETYSKKSKVSKLRELIDDSPDSPADDEQSSDDEPEDTIMKEDDRESSPVAPAFEPPKTPEPVKEEPIPEPEPVKEEMVVESELKVITEDLELANIPEPPTTPPPQKKIELKKVELKKVEPKKVELKKIELPVLPSTSITVITTIQHNIPKADSAPKEVIEEVKKEEQIQLLSIPLPSSEPTTAKASEDLKLKIEMKLDPEPVVSILEVPSSPLIDTEEDKSEPDSPARIDVLPEPPPAFLLQSEGPKIAEKLLKAINSAKRLSMSPPPVEDRPNTPKKDQLKVTRPEGKLSPIAPELKTPTPKLDLLKPLPKVEPIKKVSPELKKVSPVFSDSIFGEPSKMTDAKRDVSEVKKVKPKDPTPPRLQSPLNILERRKSVADLPLSAVGKNNKVLSDTIQKLSSQINQTAAAANIPLPPFPPEDRSDSSDSDDSDRRYDLYDNSEISWKHYVLKASLSVFDNLMVIEKAPDNLIYVEQLTATVNNNKYLEPIAMFQ